MVGHNIHFYGGKWKIIPRLSLLIYTGYSVTLSYLGHCGVLLDESSTLRNC